MPYKGNVMDEENSKNAEKPNNDGAEKKPFVEPEIKEFDDLEKQIKSPLIGTFTP